MEEYDILVIMWAMNFASCMSMNVVKGKFGH